MTSTKFVIGCKNFAIVTELLHPNAEQNDPPCFRAMYAAIAVESETQPPGGATIHVNKMAANRKWGSDASLLNAL